MRGRLRLRGSCCLTNSLCESKTNELKRNCRPAETGSLCNLLKGTREGNGKQRHRPVWCLMCASFLSCAQHTVCIPEFVTDPQTLCSLPLRTGDTSLRGVWQYLQIMEFPKGKGGGQRMQTGRAWFSLKVRSLIGRTWPCSSVSSQSRPDTSGRLSASDLHPAIFSLRKLSRVRCMLPPMARSV